MSKLFEQIFREANNNYITIFRGQEDETISPNGDIPIYWSDDINKVNEFAIHYLFITKIPANLLKDISDDFDGSDPLRQVVEAYQEGYKFVKQPDFLAGGYDNEIVPISVYLDDDIMQPTKEDLILYRKYLNNPLKILKRKNSNSKWSKETRAIMKSYGWNEENETWSQEREKDTRIFEKGQIVAFTNGFGDVITLEILENTDESGNALVKCLKTGDVLRMATSHLQVL